MSDPKKSEQPRRYEADTLNILAGRLEPVESESDSSEKSPSRRPAGNTVSGDTVRRIIDRIKGI